MPHEWNRRDEWYNFKWMADQLHAFTNIDEKSFKAGPTKMADNQSMSWYHNYYVGSAFYTALGHTAETYADPIYFQHLSGGIKYPIGKKK